MPLLPSFGAYYKFRLKTKSLKRSMTPFRLEPQKPPVLNPDFIGITTLPLKLSLFFGIFKTPTAASPFLNSLTLSCSALIAVLPFLSAKPYFPFLQTRFGLACVFAPSSSNPPKTDKLSKIFFMFYLYLINLRFYSIVFCFSWIKNFKKFGAFKI